MSGESRSFWSEVKRRRVMKVAIAYVAVALGVGAAGETFLPNLGAPDWILSTGLGLLILGLPVAILLAWAYDITPKGIERTVEATVASGSTTAATSAQPGKIAPQRGDVATAPRSDEFARATSPSSFDVQAIAVLPFANMSDDPENEFFSDGVMEEILMHLSKIADLHVISRTSAMVYKGTSKPISEISRELKVGSVLEGSVRRAGGRVRVTAQLIETATDRHLWAEQYDRDLNDIFAVQSDVAVQIADALQAELTPNLVARIRRRPTESLAAYDLLLQARQNVVTGQAGQIRIAIEQLEKAIALDPTFVDANALLGIAHVYSAYWGAARGREDFLEAKASAERALDLDASSGLALAARGGVRAYLDFDWMGADEDIKRAIEFDPKSALLVGETLLLQGRFDEALEQYEAAHALDPHNPEFVLGIGLALQFTGQPEEADRVLRRGFQQHPHYFLYPTYLAIVAKHENRWSDAADWYSRSTELTGGDPFFQACTASALRLAGAEEESSARLAEIRDDDPRIDHTVRATIAVARGDIDEVVEHMRLAVDDRLPVVLWFWLACPDAEMPRDHPGVKALHDRIWPS